MNKPAKLPPLRKWAKQHLADGDWNFPAFCDALGKASDEKLEPESWILVCRAFNWEIDRELGSGNGPFNLDKELVKLPPRDLNSRESELTLVQRSGPALVKSIERPMWLFKPRKRQQPLNEWSLCELAQHVTPATISVSRGSNDICALEIHWTDNEDDIVDAFRVWLQLHQGTIRKVPKRRGRKQAWRTSFLNLAIYRLSAAGYSRKEAILLLKENFERLELAEFSSQNYARAKRFIADEIRGRYVSLCSKAEHAAKDFPKKGYGNWRRHFLK